MKVLYCTVNISDPLKFRRVFRIFRRFFPKLKSSDLFFAGNISVIFNDVMNAIRLNLFQSLPYVFGFGFQVIIL